MSLTGRLPQVAKAVRSGRGGRRVVAAVVAEPGPEESSQAVLAPAGHHVQMNVGHALAYLVVESQERALRSQHCPLGGGDAPGGVEERAEQTIRQLRQRGEVAPWDTRVWPVNTGRWSRKASTSASSSTK